MKMKKKNPKHLNVSNTMKTKNKCKIACNWLDDMKSKIPPVIAICDNMI